MSGVRVRERALTVLTRHRKLALANVTISAITFRLGVRDDSDLWVMTRTGGACDRPCQVQKLN